MGNQFEKLKIRRFENAALDPEFVEGSRGNILVPDTICVNPDE